MATIENLFSRFEEDESWKVYSLVLGWIIRNQVPSDLSELEQWIKERGGHYFSVQLIKKLPSLNSTEIFSALVKRNRITNAIEWALLPNISVSTVEDYLVATGSTNKITQFLKAVPNADRNRLEKILTFKILSEAA